MHQAIIRNEEIAKIKYYGFLPVIKNPFDFVVSPYQHANVLKRCKNKKPDLHFSISKQNSLILRSILIETQGVGNQETLPKYADTFFGLLYLLSN